MLAKTEYSALPALVTSITVLTSREVDVRALRYIISRCGTSSRESEFASLTSSFGKSLALRYILSIRGES